MIAAQAKARQGTRTDLGKDIPAILPERKPKDTRDEIAEKANVSPRTITTAKFILANADNKTIKALLTKPDLKIHKVAKQIKEKMVSDKRHDERKKAIADGPPMSDRIIVGGPQKVILN